LRTERRDGRAPHAGAPPGFAVTSELVGVADGRHLALFRYEQERGPDLWIPMHSPDNTTFYVVFDEREESCVAETRDEALAWLLDFLARHGLSLAPVVAREAALPDQGTFIEVDNSLLWHSFRSVVARGREAFATPADGFWPTATVDARNQKMRAVAQVRPDPRLVDPFATPLTELNEWQARMARHVLAMDDLTADVLDGICAIWLKVAKHPDEMADVWADTLLHMRGLRPQKSGSGRRGGFKQAWRHELARRVAALGTTWITVTQVEVTEEARGKRGPYRRRAMWAGESPALVVSFRVGQVGLGGVVIPETCTAWRVRPGDVFARFLFGPGRQTALLSQKALAYDPYRQRWEKRLARYFAWQWKIQRGESEARTVAALLDAVGETIDAKNPIRTKERLEQALDRLQADAVIAGWQYEAGVDEAAIGHKGWAEAWRRWKVLVEPPQVLPDRYARIAGAMARPSPRLPAAPSLGERAKAARLGRGLRQLQAAEEIGIDNTVLSRIERGRAPSPDARRKIERWLAAREAVAPFA
jgi:Helix-turn-helix